MRRLFLVFLVVPILAASLIGTSHCYSKVIAAKVYALSAVEVDEPVDVRVDIHTGNNRFEYVHHVVATLVTPDEASLIFGVNPVFIGEVGPGPADAFANWTIAFNQHGTYNILINVSCVDTQYLPQWLVNSTTVEVYDSPHAEFSMPNKAYVNQTIALNATESCPRGPGLSIVSYEWRFGDGTTTTLPEPVTAHAFSSIGNYTVSLNVTDNRGLSSTTSATIRVTLFGDINFDSSVNILDISIVAYSFNSRPGDIKWNPECDLNGDDVVNIIDVSLVARE